MSCIYFSKAWQSHFDEEPSFEITGILTRPTMMLHSVFQQVGCFKSSSYCQTVGGHRSVFSTCDCLSSRSLLKLAAQSSLLFTPRRHFPFYLFDGVCLFWSSMVSSKRWRRCLPIGGDCVVWEVVTVFVGLPASLFLRCYKRWIALMCYLCGVVTASLVYPRYSCVGFLECRLTLSLNFQWHQQLLLVDFGLSTCFDGSNSDDNTMKISNWKQL